jgi:hypothetical protein
VPGLSRASSLPHLAARRQKRIVAFFGNCWTHHFCQRCALDREQAHSYRGIAFAAHPTGTANPVGAYEHREAAIGGAAVVKMVGSTPLPALRTGSRASALLQVIAHAADPAGHRIPCRSVRAPRGRDRRRSRRENVGFNTVASAAHWIANKFAPTGFAATPDSQAPAKPVGAYEHREAAIGGAAVVKKLDSTAAPEPYTAITGKGAPTALAHAIAARIKSPLPWLDQSLYISVHSDWPLAVP